MKKIVLVLAVLAAFTTPVAAGNRMCTTSCISNGNGGQYCTTICN